MKRIFSLIFCRLVLSFLSLSCEKDPAEKEEEDTGYVDVIDIYYSGRFFRKGVLTDEGATITFKGGETVNIPSKKLKVYDCTKRSLPKITVNYSKGEWMYNSIDSGVAVDKTLSDENSIPVCAAFDSTSLHIYVNNGSELVVPNSPEKSMTTFMFLSSKNNDLPESMVCEISEGSIVGTLPEGVKVFNLTPTFTFRGRAVMVDGVDQVSGSTKQDFNSDVKYTVELFDGSTVEYNVHINAGKSFPTVYLYTDNRNDRVHRSYFIPGTIRIEDLEGRYGGERVIEIPMQIKGRGNATWNNSYTKKPYRIKLDEKASVFGLPKNRDWILLANHADKSLLRNVVAMKLSEIVGMAWTPAIYNVDVYLNGAYMGLYNFCDHKEVANHRVDIDVIASDVTSGEDLEGDYYLEIDQTQDETVNWYTEMSVPMMFKEPQSPNTAQIQYIKNYISDFEHALQSSDFADPEKGYAKYIDVDSFVDNYIVQEITKNVDGNLRKSNFLTKEKGKKLRMYHVWDFDFTLGNCDYLDDYYGISNTYKDWFILYYGCQGYGSGWYYRMQQDNNFRKKIKTRWNEIYSELMLVPDFIDQQYEDVKLAAGRNFNTYPVLDTYLWPNYVVLGNYLSEVEYMRDFTRNRIVWLNSEINSPTFCN